MACNMQYSHLGELFGKDIYKLSNVTDLVNSVLKEYEHCDIEKTIVKRGDTKLKTLSETRWCFFRDSCESIKKNLDI